MDAPAAFVLSAGLGTRLAPLTDVLPKPLVPVFHKPLLTFALDALMASGFGNLALNTHPLPGAFADVFGADPHYRGRALRVFHEPRLLDTGGGMRNAREAFGGKSFLVYNGDILADLPLGNLLEHHRDSAPLATLLLRPSGGKANVRFDKVSRRVLDLRGTLGSSEGTECVYSGIAMFSPEIFDWIPDEGAYSVIPALLEAMRSGERVEGLLCAGGLWTDLGTPSAYLEAHRLLSDPSNRPSYLTASGHWPCPVHPEARLEDSVILEGAVAVGPGSVVGKNALLRDSILWPGSVIREGASLEDCIVRGDRPVEGKHRGRIL